MNTSFYTARSAKGALPVNVNIAGHAFAAGLKMQTVDRIVRTVSLEDNSGARIAGRSYFLTLGDDEALIKDSTVLRCLKIKSATDNGAAPGMEAYRTDPSSPIIQPTHKMEIENNGTIRLEPAPEHPTGTGYLEEAENEFYTMFFAHEKGIPVPLPIGFGSFPELRFMGRETGFVIMAQEDPFDTRLISRMVSLCDAAQQSGSAAKRDAFETFRKNVSASANILGRMHMNGICHTHPHLDNFVEDNGKVKICDFTNARLAKDLTREQFAARVFNDYRHLYTSVYGSIAYYNPATKQFSIGPELLQRMIIAAGLPALFGGLDATDKSGYFSQEMLAYLPKIAGRREYFRVDDFMRMTIDKWNPQRLNGARLSSLEHRSVELLLSLAGSIYQDLSPTK